MVTDPIANMLTVVRNAIRAGHKKAEVPANKISANICKVLKEEGFIRSFKIVLSKDKKATLRVNFKEDAVVGLKRVSKPGLRIYKGYRELPTVLSGLGVSVVSTSKGVVSSRKAKELKLGGEILCNVW